MTEKYQPIPHRLKNMAIGGHVAGAVDILDDNLNRNQQDINADTYRKSETYSKEQLNNMITTPEQKYVNLTAESGDTLEDIFDGIIGAADKTYRVGCWDGTEYNTGKFAEYSFDGEDFLLLNVQTPGIDEKLTIGSSKLVESGGAAKETALMAETHPLGAVGTLTVVEMAIETGIKYNIFLKSDVNVGGYVRVGLGSSTSTPNVSVAVSPEDVLAGKVVSLVSNGTGTRIYTSSTNANNDNVLDDYSGFDTEAIITWRVQPNDFDNQVRRNQRNIELKAAEATAYTDLLVKNSELYEPGFNYFSRTKITKWNSVYRISKLLKVTDDVDIDNVCTPNASDCCCVLYDKDGVLLGGKKIQSESYTAFDDIDSSDLEGATFFRICGDMRNPPVFNYVPQFAINFSDEEYLSGETSIGVDVPSAEGEYQTYANNAFNHFDEARNMEIVGLKVKFSNNDTDVDVLLFDAVTKMTHVIQTIAKESIKPSFTDYVYVKLNKPFILKANQYIGLSTRVLWKNIPKSTTENPTVNTIGGSTIGGNGTNYGDVSVAVFDYYLFVRKVDRYRIDKKLSVITDSIGTANFVTNQDRVYWRALANHTGMTILGASTIGGSSITPNLKNDGLKPFVDPDRIASLAVDNVSPDIIIIQGGVNDFNSISADGQRPCPIGSWSDDPSDPQVSFYASTRCLLNRLKTAYPQANIIFCTPPKMFASGKLESFEPLTNKDGTKMSQFVDVIKDVSKEYGVLCVDLFAELPITHENYQTYMVDTYHANDKGCALIEDLLLNKMIALYGYM